MTDFKCKKCGAKLLIIPNGLLCNVCANENNKKFSNKNNFNKTNTKALKSTRRSGRSK